MARNDNGNGISAAGHTNSARCGADFLGDLTVRLDLARWDVQHRRPNSVLKWRASRVQWKFKTLAVAVEVRVELIAGLLQKLCFGP